MSGLLFGSAATQLYGYYHPPSGTPTGSVLLCQPWGTEYQFAHRAMRLLARRLAGDGRHVLRFDYSGTGDSWGETTDADIEVWFDDVERAARELTAIAGPPARLDVIGLRLGATVAALACDRLATVDSLVMWDPILDGRAWVAADRASSGTGRPGAGRRGAGRPAPGRDGPIELSGRTVSPRFERQLLELSTASTSGLPPRTLVLWTSDDSSGGRGEMAARDGVEVETLTQPSPWVEDIAIGSGQIPTGAIERILEWVRA